MVAGDDAWQAQQAEELELEEERVPTGRLRPDIKVVCGIVHRVRADTLCAVDVIH